MSQNQSRADRSEYTQYRKSGRSGTSNQQRQSSGGVSTKGGGGAFSGPTNPSNRGSKKYNSNAPVGQPAEGNWSVDSTDSSTARAVQNGAHPTHRVPDTPVTSNSYSLKPTDAPPQKITRAVPKSPSSNVSSTAASSNVPNSGSEPKPPTTPGKGDTSKSFPLQFGSISQKELTPSPQTPMQVMHIAKRKYEVGKVTDEEQAKQRQLKSILNKLTPQNFEKLFQQVKEVNIDNVITLFGVIAQIFDKALMEPTFCEMYVDLCYHLAADLPDLSVDNEKITFKRLLLNKCQEEFESGEREEEEANKAEEEGEVKQSEEEREEKRLRARRRMLGNIRLIGELYKKRMLNERIMHECINKLLGHYQNPDEEIIEALCKLMSRIGMMVDHPKVKEFMDAYYDIMGQLSNNMKISSRVRFMLKDAIDLRKNKWQQRRKVEGPKKIEEVHRDAAQERQAQSRLGRVPSMGGFARRGPAMDFGLRNTDRALDRSLPTSPPPRSGPPSSILDMSSDKVLPEEHLRNKSVTTIKEFYSQRHTSGSMSGSSGVNPPPQCLCGNGRMIRQIAGPHSTYPVNISRSYDCETNNNDAWAYQSCSSASTQPVNDHYRPRKNLKVGGRRQTIHDSRFVMVNEDGAPSTPMVWSLICIVLLFMVIVLAILGVLLFQALI